MRVAGDKENYLDQTFGLDDPDLRKVRERLIADGQDRLSLSASEARLLQFLIRVARPRKVLEIGTLYGYSALAMARALPDGGTLTTVEKDPHRHSVARGFCGVDPRVTALVGEAREVLATLSGPFDLVFIDANKSAYPEYLNWAEAHVPVGGWILGDNSFLWGAVWGAESQLSPKQVSAMREFNARLADPSRYNSTLIPTFEGLTVAQKLC